MIDDRPAPMPPVVTAAEWQRARDELLVAEKAATRTLDVLAARRRRLPMVEAGTGYTFDTPDGPRSLPELFRGRRQLVVYQFMDSGPGVYCAGCTWFTDNVPGSAPELLAEHGITYLHMSDMPLAQIESFRSVRGLTMPFASSHGTTFSADTGAGGGFLLSVFLRDGDRVFRTYSTTSRGIDRLAFASAVLDLTPFGREEEWEDSPPGWPRTTPTPSPTAMEPERQVVGYGRFR